MTAHTTMLRPSGYAWHSQPSLASRATARQADLNLSSLNLSSRSARPYRPRSSGAQPAAL